jgi:hypothetical protein
VGPAATLALHSDGGADVILPRGSLWPLHFKVSGSLYDHFSCVKTHSEIVEGLERQGPVLFLLEISLHKHSILDSLSL